MKNKTLREGLRELGFGNQTVIVGAKRVELFDVIESKLKQRDKEHEKALNQSGYSKGIERAKFLCTELGVDKRVIRELDLLLQYEK